MIGLLCLTPPPSEALLQEVHQRAAAQEQQAMLVLGGWAVANLTVGTVGWLTAEEETLRYFHQGNAMWNVVNLGIAVPGYLGARARAQQPAFWPALPITLADQRGIFLLNLGLDAAYTSSGLLLAFGQSSPRWQGYGAALALQGTFLAAFDLTLVLRNAKTARALKPYWSLHHAGLTTTW